MTTARRLSAIIVMYTCLLVATAAGQTRSAEWLKGERLGFSVEFLNLEIGAVRFEMLPPVDTLETKLHHARGAIQSNPRFPFLRIYLVVESYFDDEFNSYAFISRERKADGVHHRVAAFDRENNEVIIQDWREPGTEVVDKKLNKLKMTQDLRDGLAAFYFLRSSPDWDTNQRTTSRFCFYQQRQVAESFKGGNRRILSISTKRKECCHNVPFALCRYCRIEEGNTKPLFDGWSGLAIENRIGGVHWESEAHAGRAPSRKKIK